MQKHSVHDLIKALNKAGKKETRDRIKYCFSKVGQSDHYKDLLLCCLAQQAGTHGPTQIGRRSSPSMWPQSTVNSSSPSSRTNLRTCS